MRSVRLCLVVGAVLAMAGSAAAQAERYLPGHKETTWVMKFSPDGSRLVTSDATTMNIWSVPAFTLVAGPYEPGVTAATFSPDGRRLYRASRAVSVDEVGARVLGNEPMLNLAPNTIALAMELSPDGSLLVVADTTDSVRGIDAATGVVRFLAKGDHRVLALAFPKDGKSFFAGSKAGDIVHIEAGKGTELARFKAYNGAVRALAVSPHGKHLAVCGDQDSWIFDLATQQKLSPIGLDCAGVEYTKDGKHLVTTSSDGLLVWSLKDPKNAKVVRKLGTKGFQGLALSPDGRFIAASLNAQVRIFDLPLVLASDFATKQTLWRGADGPVLSALALPDNRTVVTATKDLVKVWDRTRGVPVREFPMGGAALVDGKGRLLITGDSSELVNLKTGKGVPVHAATAKLELHGRPRAISRSGDLLLVGGAKVELFDLKKGTTRFTRDDRCAAVAFAPKDDQLAVGCDDATVKVLDLAGKEKRLLSGHLKEIVDVAFSASGKVLASAGKDGSARSWELTTGKPLYEVAGDSGHVMQAVALSPDGGVLAAGGASGKLTVIDIKKKQTLFERQHFEFVGHGFAGSVSDLQFVEQGKVLMSASWNSTVTFWSVPQGAPLSSFGPWRPHELLNGSALGPRQASAAERALFFAAQDLERGAERARAALSVQPPLDYRDGDYTSLMVACEKGNVPVAKLLIAAGADVNTRRGSNETCLTSAVRNGDIEMVKALIAAKADVNHVKEPQRETPLVFAAALRHHAVAEVLLGAGADVNVPTATGATPLAFAIKNNDAEMVRVLAAGKADLNAADPAGRSPLTLAARARADKAYAALIEAGADPSQGEPLDMNKVVMGEPKLGGAGGEDLGAPNLVPGEGRPLFTPYRGQQVRIVDINKVYSTINRVTCLSWPSPEAKAKGGINAWGSDYTPRPGDVGTVIFETVHCSGEGDPARATLVLIVQIGEHIVPIAESSIALIDRPALGVQDEIRRTFAEGRARALLEAEKNGRRARITNPAHVFSTINTTDCLSWPWAEVQQKAGANGWKSYKPSAGDEGVVIFEAPHCLKEQGNVFVLKVGEHYVPVGARGVVLQ